MYLVKAYHGPDFPVEGGWRVMGVWSDAADALKASKALMSKQDPHRNPAAYTKVKVYPVAMDRVLEKPL